MAKRKTNVVDAPAQNDVNETEQTQGEVLVPEHIQDQIDSIGVEIDPTKPWAEWSDPIATKVNLHSLSVEHEGTELFLKVGGDRAGRLTSKFMQLFGWSLKFPSEFIAKLSPELRVAVINERILRNPDANFQIVSQEDQLQSFTSGWRNMASNRVIAQAAYNQVALRVEGDPLIDVARSDNGGMNLRIMLGRQAEITPKKDDVLDYGFEIQHVPGTMINGRLYAKRLICLNGMTATEEVFAWQTRSNLGIPQQIEWVQNRADKAFDDLDNMTEKAREMSRALLSGDPRQLIAERASIMGLPQKQIDQVIEAFDQEPGNTEWAILNAFTRFATHNTNAPLAIREKVSSAAGRFAEGYRVVHATLPFSVAQRVGATIVEG